MANALLWAAGGTGFTFFMTALGASMVFFFRKKANTNIQRIFLGFAAGVMIAASIWSLLIPAIEEASEKGWPASSSTPWRDKARGTSFLLEANHLIGIRCHSS